MLSGFDKTAHLLDMFSLTPLQIAQLFEAADKAKDKSLGMIKTGAAILLQKSDHVFVGCSSKPIGKCVGATALQNAIAASIAGGEGEKLKACLITAVNEEGTRIKMPPAWSDRELLQDQGFCLIILASSPTDFLLKTSASLLPWPPSHYCNLAPKSSKKHTTAQKKIWLAHEDPSAQEVLNLANHWIAVDPCANSADQVQRMILSDDYPSLKKLFSSRISFGTAGLRAHMAPGYNAMNYVTVQQTAQGLANWLRSHNDLQACQERGVVIGYDARHHSEGFAHISAAVLAKYHIKVKLFQGYVATPFVPFAVVRDGCLAGIMVTASHNPKQDNGYKLYAGNGAQIVSPIDKEISTQIQDNLSLESVEEFFDYAKLRLKQGSIGYQSQEWTSAVEEDYLKMIKERLTFYPATLNSQLEGVTVYTAMHGVGFKFVQSVLHAVGITKMWVVPEQRDPDPQFPTVPYPNPEQGKGALKLAMRTADYHGARLILANDPDADRLAVAEEWCVFTGDQIGYILAEFLSTKFARHSTNEVCKQALIASTVSSKLLREMAKQKKLRFEEVLTGFKWISNKALQLEKEGYEVLLGYEEAIGFSVLNLVRDKDGLSAAATISQLSAHLYSEKSSLCEYLQDIYKKYGYFVTQNKYFLCEDKNTIATIFKEMRNEGKYFSSCGDFKVKDIRDLTQGYDSSYSDKKPRLPLTPEAQMITITFENGAVCTLRTSGTEPKIKYYCELASEKSLEEAKTQLSELVGSIIETLLQPDRFGLIRPLS